MKSQIIIIPIHNQLPFVQKCYESVMKYTKLSIIIMVDDGSDKETADWIRLQDVLNNVVSIRNEKAQGFSVACNKGIDYAMAHYDFNCLCLLNSDAEVATENWFDKVEAHFTSGIKVGVAGVMSNNALAQTIKNIPEYLKKIDSKPTVYCNIIHGFCYVVSKKLIETIGHLDNITFPHYGSEDDYSMKSIQQGFVNILIGSVYLKHANETSYTHDVRANHLKKTLPDFQKRWGYQYVDKCVRQAIKAGAYINNK